MGEQPRRQGHHVLPRASGGLARWRQRARLRGQPGVRLTRPPKKSAPARTSRCDDPPPAALLEGIAQFNQQEFFEQHETLESIWIVEPDAVRYLYQGILQIGVGLYHWRRGNWHGAVTKLRQGLEKLEPYRPACMTVDVERLVLESRALLMPLQASRRDNLMPFPSTGLPRVHRITNTD